jgi:hypothetical protein
MQDFEEESSLDGAFDIEVSALDSDDEGNAAPIGRAWLGQGLSRQARARLVVLATSALVVALLVVAGVPALRSQALNLFTGAASPTSNMVSSMRFVTQPMPGQGWSLAGPHNAESIAFAPGEPETGYTCGPQTLSGDLAVPIIVGVTHDDGGVWETMSTPAAGASCDLTVDPTNARDVLLVVSSCAPCGQSPVSKLYRTIDGGQHWSLWSLPPLFPDQLPVLVTTQWTWVGSTLFLAPFLQGDNNSTLLAASVNGQAFAWLKTDGLYAGVPSDTSINDLLATSTTLSVGLGTQNCTTTCSWVMQSRDGGASWLRLTPLFQGQPVFLMGAGADGRTLLGKLVRSGLPPNSIPVRSADGGATWSALPPSPGDLVVGYLAAAPDGTVYAEFDQNFSKVSNGPPLGIYKVVPGEPDWSYVAPSPGEGMFVVAWDAAGHPSALWGIVDATSQAPAMERHQP